MKFMNMKRFASTVMAGALALSLATPAFASTTPPANTTEIEAAYEEIPISVSVPTTGQAQINPYGLPVSVAVGENTVDLVGQQITTKPLSVKNQGTTKLDMDASLLAAPKGDVSIDGAATDANTDKKIKVDLEVIGLDDTAYAVVSDSENLENSLTRAFATASTWENAVTLAAPDYAKGAPTAPAASKSNDGTNVSPMAVLGAATVRDGTVTYGKNSIALFRLTGALGKEPENSGNPDPWKTTDGFTATIVFKFTPHVDVAASISLSATGMTNNALTLATQGDTADITATFDAGDTELSVKSWAWSSSDGTKVQVSGTTATGTVQHKNQGSATITCTATLSDDTTVTATCTVTAS